MKVPKDWREKGGWLQRQGEIERNDQLFVTRMMWVDEWELQETKSGCCQEAGHIDYKLLPLLYRVLTTMHPTFISTNWVINIWNTLPDYIVVSDTVACFKRKVSNFYYNQWWLFNMFLQFCIRAPISAVFAAFVSCWHIVFHHFSLLFVVLCVTYKFNFISNFESHQPHNDVVQVWR